MTTITKQDRNKAAAELLKSREQSQEEVDTEIRRRRLRGLVGFAAFVVTASLAIPAWLDARHNQTPHKVKPSDNIEYVDGHWLYKADANPTLDEMTDEVIGPNISEADRNAFEDAVNKGLEARGSKPNVLPANGVVPIPDEVPGIDGYSVPEPPAHDR